MHLDQSYADQLRTVLETRMSQLGPRLVNDALYDDPISTVYPYPDPQDQEIAAFVASCLSYGQRKVFVPLIRQLLRDMGPSPYQFVMNDDLDRSRFDWFSYRFNSPDDIRCLVYSLRHVIRRYGSLEDAFVRGWGENNDLRSCLGVFVGLLRSVDFSPVVSTSEGTKGFRYLVPDPAKGSACKRLNMFLRWMLRSDNIDLGLWTGVPVSSLVIPLDTHITKAGALLGLTSRKDCSWKTAVDITHSLAQLDGKDPLKYDFLLFALGAWRELQSLSHVSSS